LADLGALSDIDEPISAAQLAQASGSASAAGASSTGSTGPSAEQISMVSEMGFTAAQARKALRQTGGSIEGALEWLFSHPDDQGEEEGAVVAESAETSSGRKERGSKTLPAQYRLKAFISHKGSSVHTGHYVAHIHYPEHGWVLFNDEKVGPENKLS
jgi:ubiquitin carboxyl-terminal hydrolase 5/13